MRTVLDNLEAARDVEQFVVDYGTGDGIVGPPVFVPFNGQDMPAPSTPPTRPAQFVRVSRRPHPVGHIPDQSETLSHEGVDPLGPPAPQVNGHHNPPSPHVTTNGPTWPQLNLGGDRTRDQTSPPPPAPQPEHSQPKETSSHGSQQPISGPPNIPPPPPPEPYVAAAPHRSLSGRRQSGPLPTPGMNPRPTEHPPMPALPPPPPPTEEEGGILFYGTHFPLTDLHPYRR